MLVMRLILLFMPLFSHAQLLGEGSCPKVRPVGDFKLQKFMGVWYEFERSPVTAQEPVTCLRQEFSIAGDGRLVENDMAYNKSSQQAFDVKFSATFIGDTSVPRWSFRSKLSKCTAPKAYHCSTSFAGGSPYTCCIVYGLYTLTGQTNPFTVLLTDYTSYYLGMFCRDLPNIDQSRHHTYQMWIFTRDKGGLNNTVRYAIYGNMVDHGLDPRDMSSVSQDCDDITKMYRVLYVP